MSGSRARTASPTARSTSPPTRAARIEGHVEWGTYRLEIDAPASDALPVSFVFEAGWYVEAKALDTPEALKVSLDKPQYKVGESARVHLETRFDGIALVMVVDDRLVTTKSVEVTGNAADIDLEVTRDWGPGAYVTAFLYRPMDLEAKRMPARAVGLTWAGVDPAERDLNIVLAAPEEIRPRAGHGGRADARQPARRHGGLRHACRRRCRHPQSDPLRDARSGGLLLRPAAARHGDPRRLQPADRPHAGRARHRALRRRWAGRQHGRPNAHRRAARLPFGRSASRRGRHGACHRAAARLQRHACG